MGAEAQRFYEIIIDDPEKVAQRIQSGIRKVREFRRKLGDAFYYNWMLHIDQDYQLDQLVHLEILEKYSTVEEIQRLKDFLPK